MARFRYRMQNILDIKIQLETQAKMQFAQAQSRYNEEEKKLTALRDQKQYYVNQSQALRTGTLQVTDLRENQRALDRMDELIKAQILQVRLAQRNLENARERLQEVMADRKTHERLKEKAFDAFLEEEKIAESKEIDQLTSYMYGSKKEE